MPLIIPADIMCSRMAWYVGMGHEQEAHASSEREPSHCSYTHCIVSEINQYAMDGYAPEIPFADV